MKALIVISLALIATFAGVSAQDNPLLSIHDRVIEVYDEYEEFKHASRLAMGDHIRHLSQITLNEIIAVIAQWNRRLETTCPTLFNTEAQGEIVRGCAETAFFEIGNFQDAIFDILEEMNDASNEVSISVVSELREFNVAINYEQLDSHFDPILAAYRTRLNAYVSQVSEQMTGLAGITPTLPDNTRNCVNAAFQKLLKSC